MYLGKRRGCDEDMTVGIITMFYNSSNYGGILQAYALTKVLADCGLEAEQIRYDNLSSFSFSSRLKNKLHKYKMILKHPRMLKYQRKIEGRNRAIIKASELLVPHSKKVYKEKNIGKCLKDYSAFITGSDQVWHGEWPAYFLSFVPDGMKKIAYAVSTGKSQLSSYETEQIKKYVKEYTAISVREADMAVILQKAMPEKTVELLLDPALLLGKKDWDAIASKRKIEKSYVFCYFLGPDIKIRRIAKEYAKKYGLELVTMPHMQGEIEINDINFGDIQIYDAVPQDFLSYIKYAELVFTDSFHATVFSSVFQKQYIVFGRTECKEMNNRIETLMDIFHTKYRFIDDTEKFELSYIEKIKEVHYNNNNGSRLDEMKKHSIEFLIHSLNK